MNKQYSVLIPAYNPDKKLIELLKELQSNDIEKIVIVNDGSATDTIFKKIEKEKNPKVVILTHEVNRGKGAALKTGLKYLLSEVKNSVGVVTADADGQHIPKDIFKVGETLLKNPKKFILGYRRFGKKTPLRSRIGNNLTKFLFQYLIRLPIKDTQSGLRGIPNAKIPACLEIPYNDYEFETKMLLEAKKECCQIVQVPIATVYIDDNKSSHFNPIKDSAKIYFILFKFILSSASSVIVEYFCFTLYYMIFGNILGSQIFARTISATFNFLVNKEKVFKSKEFILVPLLKYILLAFSLGAGSYFIIILLVDIFNINVFLAKVIAEVGLFFISFFVQKHIVFVDKK
ncbi:MAG TPA: bifunctional glycosyltransferase family 2/GtrA family protein [Rickettsiales bacterium]|nr:bifunctional glycosyltransferase family 2/GtrA family protein [Rickettsiales bacterium]